MLIGVIHVLHCRDLRSEQSDGHECPFFYQAMDEVDSAKTKRSAESMTNELCGDEESGQGKASTMRLGNLVVDRNRAPGYSSRKSYVIGN